MSLKEKLIANFNNNFNQEPQIFYSPGRINIIGEHTDYNEGFVLPAAVDKGIFILIKENDSDYIHLVSDDFDEKISFNLNDLPTKGKGHWSDYILGIIDQLNRGNLQIKGFNLLIGGDIPIGSGMSSSAAVECATVFALNTIFDLGLDRIEMVKMAQQAEHDFAGVKCGIMDMFASMMGKKDHAIRLDCRSLAYEYVPMNLQGYKFVLFNSMVKHNLASSAYNERRNQCETGVKWLNEGGITINSLRDANLEMLEKYVKSKDSVVYQRCKYVVEEKLRLLDVCEALSQNEYEKVGKVMYQTHEGLSKDYKVSCEELDILIEIVKPNSAVLGGRMMGGGFGGCTINLVKDEAIEDLIKEVTEKYKSKTGKICEAYIVSSEDGTHAVKM